MTCVPAGKLGCRGIGTTTGPCSEKPVFEIRFRKRGSKRWIVRPVCYLCMDGSVSADTVIAALGLVIVKRLKVKLVIVNR